MDVINGLGVQTRLISLNNLHCIENLFATWLPLRIPAASAPESEIAATLKQLNDVRKRQTWLMDLPLRFPQTSFPAAAQVKPETAFPLRIQIVDSESDVRPELEASTQLAFEIHANTRTLRWRYHSRVLAEPWVAEHAANFKTWLASAPLTP